jgi:hypothetical protein
MSKISLKHSGGNVVSLNSPTSAPTSADVAFKLPNADGTSGQVLKTDGSGNLSFGADTGGKILQVNQSQKVDAFSHTGTTFTKIAGTDQSGSGSVYCVKITPSSSSNKILVSCQIAFAVKLISYGRLVRTVSGSDTVIDIGTDTGNGQASFFVRSSSTDHYYGSMPVNLEFLDTPNTTSEVQYSIEVKSHNGTGIAYINSTSDGGTNYGWATASTMTAKEVAG